MKFVSLFLLLAIAGCNVGSRLFVGRWNSLMNGSSTTYIFHSSGKYEIRTNVQGIQVNGNGTYSVDGDHITLNPTDAEVLGPPEMTAGYKEKAMEQAHMPFHVTSPVEISIGPPGDGNPLILHKVAPAD